MRVSILRITVYPITIGRREEKVHSLHAGNYDPNNQFIPNGANLGRRSDRTSRSRAKSVAALI